MHERKAKKIHRPTRHQCQVAVVAKMAMTLSAPRAMLGMKTCNEYKQSGIIPLRAAVLQGIAPLRGVELQCLPLARI